MTNPISGRNSPGFRFRFCVRSITHKTLYLPLAMKQLPEIKRLMEGYAPFSVFHCLSMDTVRHTFNELRKKYDFAYWCATEYYIHDMADADNIIPLRLNQHQHQIIDTFERRYFEQKHAAYIISKSFRRAGVTTCVQAYILWRQIYYFGRASNTCTASSINAHPMKENLCRFLKRDIVPQDDHILIPKADCRSYFNTYRTPDALRGIDFAYVHLANMTQWNDPDGRLSSRAYMAASGGVLYSHRTLIVMEGNIPPQPFYRDPALCHNMYQRVPFHCLSQVTKNPYFLREHLVANEPDPTITPFFHLILLNDPESPPSQPDSEYA